MIKLFKNIYYFQLKSYLEWIYILLKYIHINSERCFLTVLIVTTLNLAKFIWNHTIPP